VGLPGAGTATAFALGTMRVSQPASFMPVTDT
jgi:hypothetical protein